jgi:hypothetical protein
MKLSLLLITHESHNVNMARFLSASAGIWHSDYRLVGDRVEENGDE